MSYKSQMMFKMLWVHWHISCVFLTWQLIVTLFGIHFGCRWCCFQAQVDLILERINDDLAWLCIPFSILFSHCCHFESKHVLLDDVFHIFLYDLSIVKFDHWLSLFWKFIVAFKKNCFCVFIYMSLLCYFLHPAFFSGRCVDHQAISTENEYEKTFEAFFVVLWPRWFHVTTQSFYQFCGNHLELPKSSGWSIKKSIQPKYSSIVFVQDC